MGAMVSWDIGAFSRMHADGAPYVVGVTGAASGIGRAAARHLAALGCAVACLDRDADGCRATAADIAGAGGGVAEAFEMDVTDMDATREAIDAAATCFGRIHGLVNCAGVEGQTHVKGHAVDLDEFDAVYRINLRGALVVSKAVLPHMLAHDYGRLLHVASIAGKEGNPGISSNSAAKAGLIGLVKVLGKDYAETGITVNALAPAMIQSPMAARATQATIDALTARIPMGRLGQFDECAATIAWIVSPACGFTTGFTFDLTGGRATY
jgi:NAD(P)-dependent dehydrogenase (short-subunit alcohol dehydrogenase family)